MSVVVRTLLSGGERGQIEADCESVRREVVQFHAAAEHREQAVRDDEAELVHVRAALDASAAQPPPAGDEPLTIITMQKIAAGDQ